MNVREKRRQERLKSLTLLKSFGYQLTQEQSKLEEDFEAPLTVIEATADPIAINSDDPDANLATEFADSDDPIAHLLSDLTSEGDPAFTEFLDKVETIFGQARDYDDLSARLLTLTGTSDHTAFAQGLGNAMALAEFEGLAGGLDETGIHASFKNPKRIGSKKNA